LKPARRHEFAALHTVRRGTIYPMTAKQDVGRRDRGLLIPERHGTTCRPGLLDEPGGTPGRADGDLSVGQASSPSAQQVSDLCGQVRATIREI